MMEFVMWIVFGALAGWLAALVMHEEQGPIFDIIIGVLGALVGGFTISVLGTPGAVGFNLYSLIVAVLGSVILLAVVRAFRTD